MEKKSTSVCFLVNPIAGKNRSVKHIDWLQKEAAERWKTFEIVITGKGEPVPDLARSKSEQFDMIVACGGDGTVNQVINGIAGRDVIFGVLPIGTGNDFAKSLNLPESLSGCLDLLYLESTLKADLVRCEGDASLWCANTLGIGLDGLANFYSKKYKRIQGSAVYVLGAIKAALSFRGAWLKMTINGKEVQGKYLMATICNGKWEGGKFHLAPDASIFDGKLELVTINKISIPKVFAYLLAFKKGPAPWMKDLDSRSFETFELKSDTPLAAHADGELLGTSIKHLKVWIEKESLRVVTSY
jgi:diacylglycerol kinase (ATP)